MKITVYERTDIEMTKPERLTEFPMGQINNGVFIVLMRSLR